MRPGTAEDPAGTEQRWIEPLWEDMVVLEPGRASVAP
jgi:hypothetical protein